MGENAGPCTALHITSKEACKEPATSSSANGGLFCAFHARQVHELYKGYKRRSAELDALDRNPPKCGVPRDVGNTDFGAFGSADELRELHAYLLKRWSLLHRCVEARAYHMVHFYKDTSDFGHQKFIDRLRSARLMVGGALAHLEKRMVEVLHRDESWLAWISALQADEDRKSEGEKKRVKAAATLERAHEESLRKEMAAQEATRKEQLEKDEVWDPIELILEDQRLGYVALLEVLVDDDGVGEKDSQLAMQRASELGTTAEARLPSKSADSDEVFGAKWRTRMDKNWRKDFKEATDSANEFNERMRQEFIKRHGESTEKTMPVMRVGKDGRMRTGTVALGPNGEFDYTTISYDDQTAETVDIFDVSKTTDPEMKAILAGINELTRSHTPFASAQEKDEHDARSHDEVKRVREYLLLRLILGSPPLLAAALQHDSIDSFLADQTRVRNSDLRDLALKLSKPTFEAVHDAVSDYWADQNTNAKSAEDEKDTVYWLPPRTATRVTRSKSGKEKKTVVEEAARRVVKKARPDRIRVCGRYIHHHPKSATLPPKGWYQLAMITGCTATEANRLCSGWEEFHHLVMLAQTGYFRGLMQDWGGPHEPHLIQTWRRLNFVAYWQDSSAEADTETGMVGPARGGRRTFLAVDKRNYIVANMSRTDPAARRFVSMLQTYPSELVSWVKDCETGKVIHEPPADELWLARECRAARKPVDPNWKVTVSFDRKLRDLIEKQRPWRFDFNDCLEVAIWWRYPGHDFSRLEQSITRLLFKAHRIESPLDIVRMTLDVFKKVAEDEDGGKGPRMDKIKQIRKRIKAHKRKHPVKEEETPVRSEWYTPIERSIDRHWGPYDHDSYWMDNTDHSVSETLHDLIEEGKRITDQKTQDKFFSEKILPELMKDYKPMKDESSDSEDEGEGPDELVDINPGPSGPAEPMDEDDENDSAIGSEPQVAESVRSGDDSGWEDADDDDESEDDVHDPYVWQDAKEEALTLWQFAHDKQEEFRELQEMAMPGSRDRFLKDRQSLLRLTEKTQKANSREKQKALAQYDKLLGGDGALGGPKMYLPPNLVFCKTVVNMLWRDGESVDGETEDLVAEMEKWNKEMAGEDAEPVELDTLWFKELRAQNPPPRRSIKPAKAVWAAWDELVKQWLNRNPGKRAPKMDGDLQMPVEWERKIMTRITELWKRDIIIKPSFGCRCAPAIAGRENEKGDLYLYVDYRAYARENPDCYIPKPRNTIPNPRYLRDEMEKWQQKHPHAVYSLLKMFSGLEYWGFEMEEDDAESLAFSDPAGRSWQWKKSAKDVPYSEIEMHDTMERLMIEPAVKSDNPKDSIRHRIRVRIDTILVMGEDEEEARKWTTQATAYFRKEPMGLDIDWARSFVNVDHKFLEELPEVWWGKAAAGR